MKEKDILIQSYLASSLSAEEEKRLESLIVSGEIQLEELEPFAEVMAHLHSEDELKDSSTMDEGFYTLLEEHEKKLGRNRIRSFKLSPFYSLAAAMIIFLIAFWLGGLNRESASETQTVDFLAHLMETNEISERIHLIANSQSADQWEESGIDALLFLLIHDESSNVRLACLDVLRNYHQEEKVHEGLIRAIPYQVSSIVLIELAQSIAASGLGMEEDEFLDRLNKDFPEALKGQIRQQLIQL
ncbi:MAG: hypothetical protein AAGD28_24535 [Bacteroidota bacterium]